MDIDKPVDKCSICGADVWKSMITGKLINSCNCPKKKGKTGSVKETTTTTKS